MPYLPPNRLTRLPDVEDELRKISQVMNLGEDILRLRVTNVAPTKAREGDIRLADGTNWNPGAGAGVYAYYSGAWNKL